MPFGPCWIGARHPTISGVSTPEDAAAPTGVRYWLSSMNSPGVVVETSSPNLHHSTRTMGGTG